MINEEVSKEVIQDIQSLATYMMNTAKEQAVNTEQLSQILKDKIKLAYHKKAKAFLGNNKGEIKLKDLYKKGQLEQVNISKGEIKNIRKELNRYGVKFSVMKDKESGDFAVFFQAKDTKVIDLAFRQVFLKSKAIKKPSVMQALKNYTQLVESKQKQKEIKKDTRVKIPSKDKYLER